MFTARRIGRWSFYLLAACLVAAIVGRLGLGIYLSSRAGKEMVAHQISKGIGLPVEVKSVRLGLRESAVSLEILDRTVSANQTVILGVDSATVDLSCFDLLRGRTTPKKIDLSGVSLNLQLDTNGRILTPLPQSQDGADHQMAVLPKIQISNGRISVHQEGRPEFSVNHVELTADPLENGDVTLSGGVQDSEWASWKINGVFNCTSRSGWLDLSTENGPLALSQLKSIPFVSSSLWNHILPDGHGAINLHFSKDADRDLAYTVDIRPASANLTITDANTKLTGISGQIRITGSRIELQDLQSVLAGGTLSVGGEVVFGSEPAKATLKVAAKGLNIQELPDEWELPKDIEGELQGNANLTLEIQSDGKFKSHGGGYGAIENAKIRGIPASIALRLVSNGKRYRFENPDTNPNPAPKTRTQSSQFLNFAVLLSALQPPDQSAEQPKNPDRPTDLTANVKLRNVEIGELLEKFKVKLGYKISGKVSAEVSMSVPLNSVVKQAAYQFTGKLSSPALQLEGLTLRDLSATVIYRDGKLTLTELIGKIDQPEKQRGLPGSFHGKAIVERDPPGNVKLDFSFERIPLGEILKAVPGWSIGVRGLVTGKAEFKTPYAKLSEPSAWIASAELNSPELVFAGRQTSGLNIGLVVKNGLVSLKNTRVTIDDIPVTAEATLSLADHYPFSATVETKGTNATDLRKLIPEVELPQIKGFLEVSAHVKGTVSPFTFEANGHITASKLILANNPANNIDIKWLVTPQKLVISELKASVFGGTVNGSADIPLSGDQAGKFELNFKNVNSKEATSFVPDFPVQLGGAISGKVNGKIAASKPDQSRVSNIDVEITAPQLTVQGIPADQLVGKATFDRGVLIYKLEGKTLGGSFEVNGRYPGEKTKQPAKVPKTDRGSFKLTGLDLSRIAQVLGTRSLNALRGIVDATFEFDNDFSAGSGRVIVTGLRWGETPISRELNGVLLLQDGVLRLGELHGRFAGGDLRASGQIQIKDAKRNFFSLKVQNADSKRLAAVVPEFAQQVEGPVSLNIRLHLGSEIRGSGLFSMIRGNISGVPVADLRVPFDWTIAPGGTGRLSILEATANTGTGRVEANLKMEWGYDARVDGDVRFMNVPLRAISPELSSFSLFGNGRITGRLAVTGSHVRSIEDLTGSLVATLNQTSVKEIPILQQTIPFMNTAGLTQPFQSGEVRGNLSQGIFRVQKLVLVNPGAQLFADGTITRAGRIDLSLVAHTGRQNPLLSLFGAKLPAIGPIPITLIQDVSQFLSNRTIRLSITGTTKDPIVRLNTAALLSEEAVRFFVARYVLPSGTADAFGLGLESSAFGK